MNKKLLLAIALLLAAFNAATAWEVPAEKLTYDVMYKWGLINKKAGDVTITTSMRGADPEFGARLTAKTAKWADRFYLVRDTLRGSIDRNTFFPSFYEKVANEDGDYSHDHLVYDRSTPGVVKASVKTARRKKNATATKQSAKELTAQGVTLDMLSAFYFMRSLDFDKMTRGETVRLNVFSGRQKEVLTIHYDGRATAKLDKKEYPAYHITFTFTSRDGRKTSDNMDAWISTTPSRVPLLLEGKLPVGKVRAVYSGPLP